MKILYRLTFLISCLAFLWGGANESSAKGDEASLPLKVVVTIPPLYSLTQDLLGPLAEVSLLLSTPASPHTYHMKPSDVIQIEEADLILWIGQELESFLSPVFKKYPNKTLSVMMFKGATLYSYPSDKSGSPASGCSSACETSSSCHHTTGHLDPHIWLDPANMQVFVNALAENIEARFLSKMNAEKRHVYTDYLKENTARIIKNLKRLDEKIKSDFKKVEGTPFFVMHDALRYLQERYHVGPAYPMHVSPEQGLTLKRLQFLKKEAQEKGGRCLFADQASDPTQLEKLAQKLGLRYQTLDILGYTKALEPASYEEMITQLVHLMTACLRRESSQ